MSSRPSARDITPVGSSVPSSTHSRAKSSASVWLSSTVTEPLPSGSLMSALDVSAREDRRDEVEDVCRRHLVVAEVLDQPLLDHIDLRLRIAVDDARHQRGQLDRVLLVLEQLALEGLVEPLVGLVVELPALDRERADVVHDLAAEVVLAALRDIDLVLDRSHQALVRL